ncbi:MAG: AraC family transcriptional regulator [Massilia sp.]|jgi:transcriptional regulator GlxA family with amidase domain|nr:AraC family transcriptional regulator [Massilia sp.]
MTTPTPVLFVVPHHVLMLDLAGPAEVLRVASQLNASEAGQAPPRFALSYAGPAAQVCTSIGLPLQGIAPLPEALAEGTMVVLVGVSGSDDPVLRRQIDDACAAVADWLKRVVAGRDVALLCVCSGALMAARAGLLDGRRCTTHHSLCASLQDMAPRAVVLENRLYVADGAIWTSAGITAGIDMMLHVLAERSSPRAAAAVARKMVVYMRRAGADPQLSAWTTGRNHLHPGLHRVQDAIAADPTRHWQADDMARLACSSTRHLARLFQEYTGGSPLDHVHRLRVALAREIITQSSLDMESVAQRAGFSSARHLRRIWRKFHDGAPSDDRAHALAEKH